MRGWGFNVVDYNNIPSTHQAYNIKQCVYLLPHPELPRPVCKLTLAQPFGAFANLQGVRLLPRSSTGSPALRCCLSSTMLVDDNTPLPAGISTSFAFCTPVVHLQFSSSCLSACRISTCLHEAMWLGCHCVQVCQCWLKLCCMPCDKHVVTAGHQNFSYHAWCAVDQISFIITDLAALKCASTCQNTAGMHACMLL